MNSVWFISAAAISFLAIWVAWAKAPQWARRARINARLHRLADQDEEASSFWLSRLASQFTESSIARGDFEDIREAYACLLYTSPSPRDKRQSRMPSSA